MDRTAAQILIMSSTLAIIVTYNPAAADLGSLLARLRGEPVETIVIDNGSSNIEQTATQVAAHVRVGLIRLERNFGIAHAQNIGLKKALAGSYQFALLLDQDSLPEAGFVERAHQAFRTLDPEGRSVAAVGPSHIDSNTEYSYPFVRFSRFSVHVFRPSAQYEDVSLLISSGSMLNLVVLPAIGLMNEAFFIDHVDTEWCLRASAKGFRMIGMAENQMRHSVGDATIRIAGRNLPSHNPKRRYLATRNLFYLIFHQRAPFQWKIKEATTSVLKLALVLPSVKYRSAHVRSYLLGALDGMTTNFSRVNQ